jgi:hypothetical protein
MVMVPSSGRQPLANGQANSNSNASSGGRANGNTQAKATREGRTAPGTPRKGNAPASHNDAENGHREKQEGRDMSREPSREPSRDPSDGGREGRRREKGPGNAVQDPGLKDYVCSLFSICVTLSLLGRGPLIQAT